MKIAVCFRGISRSLSHTIDSIRENVIAPSRTFGEVRVFTHLFDQKTIDNPRSGEKGELVCTAPFPSMPIGFWNDPDDRRYRESYFDSYAATTRACVWRHGDWLELVSRSAATGGVIYGRSDATINRQGIRFGTSELYRAIETHPDVIDSLAIDLEYLGRPSWLGLFVVLRPGAELTTQLSSDLKACVRNALSPRHIPDEIFSVPAIPYTLTGKRLEIPIKRLLLGHSPETVLNRDSVSNPESLNWFIDFAAKTEDIKPA